MIKQPQWLLLPVWQDKFRSVQYIELISALMYCLEYGINILFLVLSFLYFGVKAQQYFVGLI